MRRLLPLALIIFACAAWIHGTSVTTWNPTDKDPGITLSGGNLVATSTQRSNPLCNEPPQFTGFCGIRSTNQHSSGVYYFEVVGTNLGIGTTQDNSVGIANNNYKTWAHVGGSNGGAIGIRITDGAIELGDAVQLTITPAGTNGTVVGVAPDLSNKLIWFCFDNGNWNGSAANNPCNGLSGGGISFNAALTGTAPWYAAVSGSNDANTSFTATFAPPFAEPMPLCALPW